MVDEKKKDVVVDFTSAGGQAEAPEDLARKVAAEPRDEVPTDLVALPTRGLLYGNDNPLFNTNSVEIRHMTAAEEDILTSRSLLRSGEAIDMVLKNCLVNKLLDPKMLYGGDKNAIMISLRVSGYGPEYPIDVVCPECNEQSRYQFDLSALEVRELELEPVEPGKNEFEFELPTSKSVVHFKYLTSKEEKDMKDELEAIKKRQGSPIDKTVTTTLKKQVVSIDGDITPATIYKLIDRMHVRDSRELRKFIEKNEPDVIMKQQFACNSCGAANEVDVPITPEFFWPDI